jgi:uncharacterized protein (DUF488 family)
MADEPVIFTIGYEKRSVDDLIWALQTRGVERVVDVRLTPHSRRKGFSKTALGEALSAAGIGYEHRGALGNPVGIRDVYLSGDYQGGHRLFREHLENGAGQALDDLAATLDGQVTALLCLERDAYRCHRSVVALMAAERLPAETAVIHV